MHNSGARCLSSGWRQPTLSGASGTTKLSEFGLYFHRLSIPLGALHPTETHCVRSNDGGALGEWRNGALTVQAVAVDDDGTDAFNTDTGLSSGGVQGAIS